MKPEIINKLDKLISKGINTEVEIVYLLVQIRKLLEIETNADYPYLKFHCDWILHSKLSRKSAKEILKKFECILPFEEGKEPSDEIKKISKMIFFKDELLKFLESIGIKFLQDWAHFLSLYTVVISDIPLEINSDTEGISIKKIVVDIKFSDELVSGERYFKVIWNITDQRDQMGEVFVINSYSNLDD